MLEREGATRYIRRGRPEQREYGRGGKSGKVSAVASWSMLGGADQGEISLSSCLSRTPSGSAALTNKCVKTVASAGCAWRHQAWRRATDKRSEVSPRVYTERIVPVAGMITCEL